MNRADTARRQRALRDAQLALDADRPADAERILGDAVARTTLPPPPTEPRPATVPDRVVPNAKADARARKVAVREARAADPVVAGARRKAQVACGLLVVTSRAMLHMPEVPLLANAPGVKPLGSLGNMLQREFRDDPALTPDEAVAVICLEAKRRMRPYRLTKGLFSELVTRGRSGPYRVFTIYDQAGGRGLVDVPLGLTRFRPVDPNAVEDERDPGPWADTDDREADDDDDDRS